MEREIKKLTTPLGHEFEVYTYLTARERNALRSVYLDHVKVDPENPAQMKIGDLSGELLERAEKKLIELIVASYDGKKEGVLDAILDGRPEDYDAIVAECNKIGNFAPAK